MTLELVLRSYAHDVRTDRVSQDLRAYVRSEWRGDASWLRREASRAPLGTRFRRWLGSRKLAAPSPASSVKAPRSTDSAVSAEPMELVEPCPHADVDELGFSGGVVFLRCLLCGDVLVVDRGQEWTLCSDASTRSADPLRA
jgi:hypothetical protein